MSDTITISKKEYITLLQNQLKLEKLEGGGVDNWQWYSDSLNEGKPFYEECEEIENKVKTKTQGEIKCI